MLGQIGLQLGRQLMRLHRPHPPQPGPPAGGAGISRQRRLDLGLLQRIDLERQPDGRGRDRGQFLADIGLEPVRRRIVPRRRGRQKGIGPEPAQGIRRLFVQADRAIQQPAERRRVGAGRDQLPL